MYGAKRERRDRRDRTGAAQDPRGSDRKHDVLAPLVERADVEERRGGPQRRKQDKRPFARFRIGDTHGWQTEGCLTHRFDASRFHRGDRDRIGPGTHRTNRAYNAGATR
jgi:hypothetical protein